LIAEFYGVIYALKKAQKLGLTKSDWNVTLSWFVLGLCCIYLLGQMFLGCFVIDEILVLVTVEKSGLGLLIFFVKGMRVPINFRLS